MMDSGTEINLFRNTNIITNRQNLGMSMNFLTNARSKIVDDVQKITGAGQTKFYPEMIANVLILNEMTNNSG